MLSLGLMFCLTQKADSFEVVKYVQLFARKLMYKTIFDKNYLSSRSRFPFNALGRDLTLNEIKAIEELMEL